VVDGLDRLWAGWRSAYVSGPPATSCVFCSILGASTGAADRYLLAATDKTAALLNAFPYTSGHLLVLPIRHVASLAELAVEEANELIAVVGQAVRALERAYGAEGINVGMNLGRAAGAGIPDHLHFHVLPRFVGDTNFMTSTANTRVLPEALSASFARLEKEWRQP
jgi:ATP adenylyltransferase